MPKDSDYPFRQATDKLLREQGWYYNNGYRDGNDSERGYATGLSAGQAIDELLRREKSKVNAQERG